MDNNVSKNTFCDKFFKLHFNIDSIAVKSLLQQQLWYAINSYQQTSNYHVSSQSLMTLISEKIILSRCSKSKPTDITYRCAICFPLAYQWQLSPLTLAKELISIFTTIQNPSQTIDLEFELELVASGLIDFSVKKSSLTIWFNQLIVLLKTVATIGENYSLPNHNSWFWIQYVHARCCSLLRLGQKENLIKLKSANFWVGSWQVIYPDDLFCIDNQGFWEVEHQSERALIIELLELSDLLASDRYLEILRSAESLSQAMLDFEANCRIFGSINPKLARARLGLVALVQYFLALFLHQLGTIPLSEL